MNSLRIRRAALSLLASILWLALAGCGGSSSGKSYSPPTLADGVIFTYPINGQSDVPLGTRFYVTFSKNVSTSAVTATCSSSGGNLQSGNFCLLDADGNVVPIAAQVKGKVVQFESTALRQGQRYRLFVRDGVIGGGNSNLPGDALLSFTTSQMDPVKDVQPAVTAINGEHPDVYRTAPMPPALRPASRYPFMDFATLRVEFSEPLDEKSVQVGSTFRFVMVDENNDEVPVAGALIVRKQHVVFDPQEDLLPGAIYRLHLSSGIHDMNGEALAAASFEMVPEDANACDCVMTQYFKTMVAFGDAGFPATSALTGQPVNAIDLYSPLIGSNDIYLRGSTLEAELADPSRFGGLIPFVIRKGNFLDITGLDLALGGAVPANLRTGDIRATFLSDATGFLGRSPYRSADVRPDDAKSPVFVYLIFDLALTAHDEQGNAVLNQTIPHVQATGTAQAVNGRLQIETVRTLTMDLLGLDLAPAHMVLAIASDLNGRAPEDNEATRLTGAYPADGAVDFPVTDGLSLIFSKPIDNADMVVNRDIQLLNLSDGGVDVPFQMTYDGSTVLLKPDASLGFGKNYQIRVGALQDVNGNALVLDGDDASGGDGVIEFATENPSATGGIGPMISSIYPGAACLLEFGSGERRCYGGKSDDTHYLPFEMPTDGVLDVQFNQPMNANTFVLGSSCNTGTVRVELLNSSGACVEVVPGSLTVDTRAIRFKPTQPWQEGASYRLTLVSDIDPSCVASSEICGINDRPLNADPLRGAQAGDAGAAHNLAIRFQGVAALGDDYVYLPLKLEPFSDINGNGFLNTGEVGRIENSAEVTVTGTSGLVTDAVIEGDPRIYLNGSLPVTIGLPEALQVNGEQWEMALNGHSQIPVHVHPGTLYGTSITIKPSALVTLPTVPTGLNILRLRETDDQPIMGYIVQEAGVEQPQFISQFDLYMDAPDMSILAGAATHDLNSKLLSGVTVKGPITFMSDGRIVIELGNAKPVDLAVNIRVLDTSFLPGTINLRIPENAMQLRLLGEPLKGRR